MRKLLILATSFLVLVTSSWSQVPMLVKDIFPLKGAGCPYPNTGLKSWQQWSAVIGNKLVFQANNSTHGTELWISDGTEAGTVMLKDIAPGDRTSSSNPRAFLSYNGIAYFFTNRLTPNNGGLWRTDGTEKGTYIDWEGTYPFGDMPYIKTPSSLYYLTPQGNMIRRDPKGTGTFISISKQLSDNIQNTLLVYGSTTVTKLGDRWLFLAELNRDRTRTLMVTNETRPGTYSLNSGAEGLPGKVTGTSIERSGNQVFFVNDDGRTGSELWVTDGSQEGTHLVKNIGAGGTDAQNLNAQTLFAAVPNGLVFIVNDGKQRDVVWFSDGTEAGTKPIKQPSASDPSGTYASYGCTAPTTGDVYFYYKQGLSISLWRTDGTTSGTVRVLALPQGDFPALTDHPETKPFFLSTNGSTYFLTKSSSTDGTVPHNVWRIDERTRTVSKVGRLPNCSYPPHFQIAGNYLYYIGFDQQTGNELWKLPFSQQTQRK